MTTIDNVVYESAKREPTTEQILATWQKVAEEYPQQLRDLKKECKEKGHVPIFGPMEYHSGRDQTVKQEMCTRCGHIYTMTAKGNILGNYRQNIRL